MNPTPAVKCEFGAPMGRWGIPAGDFSGRLYLHHVPLNSGGYDRGGAYWGLGSRLYAYWDADETILEYLRAPSRQYAKAAIRDRFPDAKFFN